MATIRPAKAGYQHFAGSGKNTVDFQRSINHLNLTIIGNVNLSLDNGCNFMNICTGTHEFDKFTTKKLHFEGTGSYTGVGVAI